MISSHVVFAFGKESNGVLGVGPSDKPILSPTILFSLLNVKIKGIATGDYHSLAWDDNGSLYSWGDHTEGKLGHGID